MGTRAYIYFYASGKDIPSVFEYPDPDAIVYSHFDGNPGVLGRELLAFLEADREARYVSEDPCFLSGRFLFWKTERLKESKARFPIPADNPNYDFSQMIALGPVTKRVGSGGYVYHVLCGAEPEVLVDGVWDRQADQAADPLLPLEDALEIERRETVR
jgi:hypothetical protein